MKQNGCKFKRAVAGASLAMLLALQGAPAVALANESIELDGANAIAVVEEEQQAVASLEEGQEVESQSEATNTVFGTAEEVSFGIPVEGEFSYDAKGNFETYYYKFKTSTFHARYQVTLDSLSGKRVHFEVRDQNNEKWKGTGGSTAKNFCYTTSRGYCYKDNADFDTWFYVKVVHCQAQRYDKFRLTVTELPSISSATVTGIKASKWYTGKEIEQEPVVELDGVTLREGYDYSISYKNNKLVGMATMTITGAGAYSGTIVETFDIVNAKNPIKAKATKSS